MVSLHNNKRVKQTSNHDTLTTVDQQSRSFRVLTNAEETFSSFDDSGIATPLPNDLLHDCLLFLFIFTYIHIACAELHHQCFLDKILVGPPINRERHGSKQNASSSQMPRSGDDRQACLNALRWRGDEVGQ